MVRILLVNNEAVSAETEWGCVLKGALLEVGAEAVDVVHYSQLETFDVYEGQYDCFVLSGREETWDPGEVRANYGKELALIEGAGCPVLGICAGMQLIGVAFGANFDRMVAGQDKAQEEGFITVLRIKSDELFEGVSNSFCCYSLHADELKNVPEGFERLAESSKCAIQGIRHREKLIYGIQFHPEKWDEAHLDGLYILRNFFKLVEL